MNYTPLTAISPIDGRYHSKTKAIQPYYSEYGLIRYRVLVEVEYFLALTAIPLPSLADFPSDCVEPLRDLYRNFSEEDALWIKRNRENNQSRCKSSGIFSKRKDDTNGIGKVLRVYSFWPYLSRHQ